MVSSGPRMAPPKVAPAPSGVATSFTADSRSTLAKPSRVAAVRCERGARWHPRTPASGRAAFRGRTIRAPRASGAQHDEPEPRHYCGLGTPDGLPQPASAASHQVVADQTRGAVIAERDVLERDAAAVDVA